MIDRRILLAGLAALAALAALGLWTKTDEADIRTDAHWQAFWDDWQTALASEDPEQLADLTRFPLQTSKGRCDRHVFLTTIAPDLVQSVALIVAKTPANALPVQETETRVIKVSEETTLHFGPAPEGWRLVGYLRD
jgi:hypothetical protein